MRSLKFRRVGFGLALLGLVGAITLVWATRGRVAQHFVIEALRARGVPASATIETIGPEGLIARNLWLGDPAHPDLTADRADIAFGWIGLTPHLAAVHLVRPSLHARIDIGGRITIGTLDHLRAPPDGTPGRLPDLDFVIDEGRLILATPYGSLTASLSGRGNPAHSFAGRLRLAPATLTIAGCRAPLTDGDLALGARRRIGTVAGTLDFGPLACGLAAVDAANVQLDLALADPLTRAQGRIAVALTTPVIATGRAASVKAIFEGSAKPTRIQSNVRMESEGLAYGNWTASVARVVAHLDFDPATEPPAGAGQATIEHAALARASRTRLALPTPGLAPTPLGPLEAATRAALARAAADFSASADVSLNLRPSDPYNNVKVRTASGAQASYRHGIDSSTA